MKLEYNRPEKHQKDFHSTFGRGDGAVNNIQPKGGRWAGLQSDISGASWILPFTSVDKPSIAL